MLDFLVLSLISCATENQSIRIGELENENIILQNENSVLKQELENQKLENVRLSQVSQYKPQPFSTADIEKAKELNVSLKELIYFLSKPLIISANNETASGRADKGVFVINGEISNENRKIETYDEGTLDKFDDNSFDITYKIKGSDSKYTVNFKKNNNSRFNVDSVKYAGKVIENIDKTFWKDNYLSVMVDWEYKVIQR
jgi:hypothetical protein